MTVKALKASLGRRSVDIPSDVRSKQAIIELHMQHVPLRKRGAKAARESSDESSSEDNSEVEAQETTQLISAPSTTTSRQRKEIVYDKPLNTTPNVVSPKLTEKVIPTNSQASPAVPTFPDNDPIPPVTEPRARAHWMFRHNIISSQQRDADIEEASLATKEAAKKSSSPTELIITGKIDNSAHIRYRTRIVNTMDHPFPSELLRDFMCDVHKEDSHYTDPHFISLKKVHPGFYKIITTYTFEEMKAINISIPAFRTPWIEFLGHCAALYYCHYSKPNNKCVSGIARSFYCSMEELMEDVESIHKYEYFDAVTTHRNHVLQTRTGVLLRTHEAPNTTLISTRTLQRCKYCSLFMPEVASTHNTKSCTRFSESDFESSSQAQSATPQQQHNDSKKQNQGKWDKKKKLRYDANGKVIP
jgi:hypothetical protein